MILIFHRTKVSFCIEGDVGDSSCTADPLMSECLIYQLKPGRTTVITFERHTFLSDSLFRSGAWTVKRLLTYV